MIELKARAKVMVMTVDGAVQVSSGLAMHSAFFAGLRVKACVVDECQQLEHGLVCPLAFWVEEFMLLIGDDGQSMSFQRQASRSVPERMARPGDYYSWERAVHGGTHTPPGRQYAWKTGGGTATPGVSGLGGRASFL